MKRLWTVLASLALVVGLTACGLQAPERANIVDTLAAEGDFGELLGLVTEFLDADTVAALASDEAGPFTVFAPTDAAIAAFLDMDEVKAALAGPSEEELIEALLLYHVLAGRYTPQALIAAGSETTLAGINLFFGADGAGWALNQATQDVAVAGGPIQATNGTIYVIDEVLLPPTLAEIAILSPDFDVLVAALSEAGLVPAVNNPFAPALTVFAPTDAAFGAALEALGITAEQLLASDDLSSILLYHVVPGRLAAADVIAAVTAGAGTASVPTLLGPAIDVTIVDGGVVLNDEVNVIVTDVFAINGVIHVIDFVLLPPTEQ